MTECRRQSHWPLFLIVGLIVGIIPAAAKRGSNSSIEPSWFDTSLRTSLQIRTILNRRSRMTEARLESQTLWRR